MDGHLSWEALIFAGSEKQFSGLWKVFSQPEGFQYIISFYLS